MAGHVYLFGVGQQDLRMHGPDCAILRCAHLLTLVVQWFHVCFLSELEKTEVI